MAPLPHGVADMVPGFQHDRLKAAFQQMGGGGKADWYLPSRDELRTLFLREKKVGPFIFHGYWSSSESAPDQAWIQDFYLEAALQTTEKGYANYVRPVRAF